MLIDYPFNCQVSKVMIVRNEREGKTRNGLQYMRKRNVFFYLSA